MLAFPLVVALWQNQQKRRAIIAAREIASVKLLNAHFR
jgi:hypothetical protein